MSHTKESLEALPFRDLQKLVKDLGQNAQGTKEELVAKVLELEFESGPSGNGESPAEETTTSPEGGSDPGDGNDAPPVAPVPTSPEQNEAPEAPVAPEVPAGPTTSKKIISLSSRAKAILRRNAAQYLSTEGYDAATESLVVSAIESGKQPCIVRAEGGNRKFALSVREEVFDIADVSKDVSPSRASGVVMNLARRLADANLYPRS